jgi:hypothetical protein
MKAGMSMKAQGLVMMTLVGALAGTAFAQEALPPAATVTQQAAPAVTAPAATPNPANAPTSSSVANASQAKAPATTTAAVTPAGPTPAVLKRARQHGYQIKVSKGITYFCKKTALIGSHFVDEKCLDQERFETTLEKQQIQRDQLNQSMGLCAVNTGACGAGNM